MNDISNCFLLATLIRLLDVILEVIVSPDPQYQLSEWYVVPVGDRGAVDPGHDQTLFPELPDDAVSS